MEENAVIWEKNVVKHSKFKTVNVKWILLEQKKYPLVGYEENIFIVILILGKATLKNTIILRAFTVKNEAYSETSETFGNIHYY